MECEHYFKKTENCTVPMNGKDLSSDLAQYKLFHLPHKAQLQISPSHWAPTKIDCVQRFLML